MAESDKDGGAVGVVSKAGGSVERLSDFSFALHILPAFLALDVGLLVTRGTNVVTTDWSSLSKDSLGFGICVIVSYIVAMTIGVPIVRFVVEPALRKLVDLAKSLDKIVSDALFAPQQRIREPAHEGRVSGSHVLMRVVRDRALREKDTFWLTQVQKKEAELESAKRAQQSLAFLSFATLLFTVLDGMFFSGSSILSLFVHQISAALGAESDAAGFALVTVLALGAGLPWLAEALAESTTTAWIEHPALAQELMDEFYKNRVDLLPPRR